MSTLFFSYSHVDENLRDQLEKHLSGLRRQGIISSWHDRRITAGTELAGAIDSHIDTADIILLLISPDFIASDYCYERETSRALARHEQREARVIPVILRPCDWQSLPFGKLLATPTDGRPITMWPNIDQAFLAVVTPLQNPVPETIRTGNLRVKKQFTDFDKDRYRHDGFEYIAKFFDNSLKELRERHRLT